MEYLEGGLVIVAIVMFVGAAVVVGFVLYITKDGGNIFR